jgi:high-affinity Fe2+/Pb2+ permease
MPLGYEDVSPTQRLRRPAVIGVLIAVLLAALVYFLCVALGLPAIVAIVAAILVLLAGIPTGGYGIGGRFGGRSRL